MDSDFEKTIAQQQKGAEEKAKEEEERAKEIEEYTKRGRPNSTSKLRFLN